MKLFSNSVTLNDDPCYSNYKDNLNKKTSSYYLSDINLLNEHHKSNEISLDHQCFQIRDGLGWTNKNGNNIDDDSKFRKHHLTNLNVINNLNHQHTLTGPYLHRELPVCVDKESSLRPKLNHDSKSLKNYTYIDSSEKNFIPIINNLKKKINLKHIIQENTDKDWTRGGITSRELMRDPVFLKSQGYRYNGKYWHR